MLLINWLHLCRYICRSISSTFFSITNDEVLLSKALPAVQHVAEGWPHPGFKSSFKNMTEQKFHKL